MSSVAKVAELREDRVIAAGKIIGASRAVLAKLKEVGPRDYKVDGELVRSLATAINEYDALPVPSG